MAWAYLNPVTASQAAHVTVRPWPGTKFGKTVMMSHMLARRAHTCLGVTQDFVAGCSQGGEGLSVAVATDHHAGYFPQSDLGSEWHGL